MKKVDFSLKVNFDDDEFEEEGEAKRTNCSKQQRKQKSSTFPLVPNQTRRQWKDKFGTPSTPYTVCPNLDKIIKTAPSDKVT